MTDLMAFFLQTLFKAWGSGGRFLRAIIVTGIIFSALGGTVWFFSRYFLYDQLGGEAIAVFFVGAGFFILFLVSAREKARETEKREERIEKIEDQVRDNPKQPQLAWDLARTKLAHLIH